MQKPIRNRGHGGPRLGAGRPRKWSFEAVLTIGQSCEVKWREASTEAFAARLAALPHADEIGARWEEVQAIPVWQRKAWIESEAFEDHSGDIGSWLHKRAGTRFDDETATYAGAAPRLVTLSTKPPRGTRQAIIREVATNTGLVESQVDNLWQEYRRFERELQSYRIPPNLDF